MRQGPDMEACFVRGIGSCGEVYQRGRGLDLTVREASSERFGVRTGRAPGGRIEEAGLGQKEREIVQTQLSQNRQLDSALTI